MLNRDQILNRQAGRFEVVAVPEWGGDVRLRALCVRDRAIIETEFGRLGRLMRSDDPDAVSGLFRLQLTMVALSVVGEDGSALFTLDDLPDLEKQEPDAIRIIADAASALNGFATKAVEDAAKN